MKQKDNFRLQPVLNLKTSMVDTLEVEFARLKQIQLEETRRLKQLEQTKESEMDTLRSQQNGRLNCHAIQMHQQYLQALDQVIHQQNHRVETAKHKTEHKREELVKTVQDQKTLEKLKEQHTQKQQLELSRKEARVIDDLVVSRYKRHGQK
jgi:flagellar export protein FliJ